MEAWPSSILPKPDVDFNGELRTSVLYSKLGAVGQRRRFYRELRAYRVSWALSDFQYGMFQSWFLHKISSGSDWFTLELAVGDGLKVVNAHFEDARFSATHNGVLNWTVTAVLELDTQPMLTEAQYDTEVAGLGLTLVDDVWPTYLPNPTVTLSLDLRQQSYRVRMESGRFRQQRRFTQELRRVRVSWNFDDFQWAMFQAWLYHKRAGGSLPFTVLLPLNGDSLQPVVARLLEGNYTVTYDNVLYWTVSATLEVYQANVWGENDYDALLVAGSVDALEAAVARVDTFVDT